MSLRLRSLTGMNPAGPGVQGTHRRTVNPWDDERNHAKPTLQPTIHAYFCLTESPFSQADEACGVIRFRLISFAIGKEGEGVKQA